MDCTVYNLCAKFMFPIGSRKQELQEFGRAEVKVYVSHRE